jgi:hypothetical protein
MKLGLQSFRGLSLSLIEKFGGISNGNEPCDLAASDVFLANSPDGIMLSLRRSL